MSPGGAKFLQGVGGTMVVAIRCVCSVAFWSNRLSAGSNFLLFFAKNSKKLQITKVLALTLALGPGAWGLNHNVAAVEFGGTEETPQDAWARVAVFGRRTLQAAQAYLRASYRPHSIQNETWASIGRDRIVVLPATRTSTHKSHEEDPV